MSTFTSNKIFDSIGNFLEVFINIEKGKTEANKILRSRNKIKFTRIEHV